MMALAFVGACSSTAVVGPIAGAPSGHTARSYETMDSTAAVTSRLGGSVLRWTAGSTTPEPVSMTGNITGDTGRTALNDGAYVFVYQQGRSTLATRPCLLVTPNTCDKVADGHGAYGTVGNNRFAGTYAYVRAFNIQYPNPVTGGSGKGGFDGFAGIVTTAGDMPSGGSASYTGEAAIDMFRHGLGATSPQMHLDRGTSTITADFAAGTATVDLGSFSGRTDCTNTPISPAAAAFDQVTGRNLTISGSQFTGGTWKTLKCGTEVFAVGTNQTTNANGTFFGYDPSISAPDEVAGVFVINGSTSIVTGRFIAD